MGAGAIQLMQMQADLKRQIEAGQMEEQGVEAYLASKQELMIGNLWKLNVADIENTVSKVSQKVLLFSSLLVISACVIVYDGALSFKQMVEQHSLK